MKAKIRMGEKEYEGEFLIDCFFTDKQWWIFAFEEQHFDDDFVIARHNFKSREEALEDARAHGITIEDKT